MSMNVPELACCTAHGVAHGEVITPTHRLTTRLLGEGGEMIRTPAQLKLQVEIARERRIAGQKWGRR